MNRLTYFLVAVIFACSPVKGTPLIDAEVLSIESMQIMPGSASLRLGLDPPLALAVSASLSDGTTRDVTTYVTWSTSDQSVASAPFGALTALHSGSATITATLGTAMATAQVSVRDALIAVTTRSQQNVNGTIPQGILIYDAFASGSATALRSIRGSGTTQLGNPFGLAADVSNNELFLVDQDTGVWVYPLDGNGSAVMPIRHIPTTTSSAPTLTRLQNMFGLRLVGDELYVVGEALGSNNTSFGAIAVYPRLGDGSNTQPFRLIGGSNSNIGAPQGMGIGSDVVYVANLVPGEVVAFPINGDGDIAPTQVITGSATQILEPIDIHVVGNELFVGDLINGILAFPLDAGSNTAPTRWIHGPDTQLSVPTAFAKVGETLVCGQLNTNAVTTDAIEATEDTPPVSTLSGSASSLVNPIGLTAF